eukprot:scaffold10284_cov118-Isochrysis_galbana.AAC.18
MAFMSRQSSMTEISRAVCLRPCQMPNILSNLLERLSEQLAIVRLPGADPMMTAAEAQSGCRAAVRAGGHFDGLAVDLGKKIDRYRWCGVCEGGD